MRVGDEVALTVQFQRSIGDKTVRPGGIMGKVTGVVAYGEIILVTVKWNDPGRPTKIDACNLDLIRRKRACRDEPPPPEHIMNLPYYSLFQDRIEIPAADE